MGVADLGVEPGVKSENELNQSGRALQAQVPGCGSGLDTTDLGVMRWESSPMSADLPGYQSNVCVLRSLPLQVNEFQHKFSSLVNDDFWIGLDGERNLQDRGQRRRIDPSLQLANILGAVSAREGDFLLRQLALFP